MNILALDIETSPNVVYTWGLHGQDIALNQVIETSRVLCFAAKWIGPDAKGGTQFYAEWHPEGRHHMVEEAHRLLDEADVVVHWNGSLFDIPHLNREFLEIGLPAPSHYRQVDLMQVVKRHFRFQSNKLEHVAQELLGHGKVKHDGFDLWKGVLDGDPKAQRKMERYNKQDVVLLDEMYNVLLPWIPTHPARLDVGLGCPRCGAPADALQKRGFRHTQVGRYQQYQCQVCMGWVVDRKSDGSVRPLRRPA